MRYCKTLPFLLRFTVAPHKCSQMHLNLSVWYRRCLVECMFFAAHRNWLDEVQRSFRHLILYYSTTVCDLHDGLYFNAQTKYCPDVDSLNWQYANTVGSYRIANSALHFFLWVTNASNGILRATFICCKVVSLNWTEHESCLINVLQRLDLKCSASVPIYFFQFVTALYST